MRLLAHFLSGGLALLALALLIVAMRMGMLMNALFVLSLLAMPIIAGHRLVAAIRERLVPGFWRNPFKASARPYLPAALLRIGTWILVGTAVQYAMVPEQFGEVEFTTIRYMIWGPVIVLSVLALFPHKNTRLAPPLFHAALSILVVSQFFLLSRTPDLDNAVTLAPPVKGEWLVLQGGSAPLTNHHFFAGSQRLAIDLIKPEDGPRNSGALDKFAGFGEPIMAPINGTVVAAVGDRLDLQVGESDSYLPAGNHIVIKSSDHADAFILLAHLKNSSLKVNVGDSVRIGQVIGACGNTGNTTAPHLHLQAMTAADYEASETKPLPMLFTGSPPTPTDRPLQRHDRLVGE